jgi:signal transduction histidine kinase
MEFQPIRLDTMVKDLPLRARSFKDDLKVAVNIHATDIKVEGDPTRLAQVFDNLLSNAVKYAPGSNVIIDLTTENNNAQISFSDYGPGIAPNHLSNIFSRFYRVPDQNRSVRGTGLGLFICRRIINAHGGEITAESNLGEGTTFHIIMPLADNSSQEPYQYV